MAPPSVSCLLFPRHVEFPRPVVRCAGDVRLEVFAPVPDDLVDATGRWLELGTVPGATALKPRFVYRLGDFVVKFFPPASGVGRLRPPAAMRSAERHFRCRPIRSPRPWLALARGGGASLLVREYVEGRSLAEVWSDDVDARRALPGFLADMTCAHVRHGDLHPLNLLWSDGAWMFLDVDGLRHRLHRSELVQRNMWARLVRSLGDEPGLREAFEVYRSAVVRGGQVATTWARVLERVPA